jgi:predicted nucleic acid-binding protein
VTVLIDTSIWSIMLRRDRRHLSAEQQRQVASLEELVATGKARLLGVVRQELLTGIKHSQQFQCLQQELRNFADVQVETEDHERAAEVSNACEARGILGSSVDMLICSVAMRRGWTIFTADRDFEHYARILPIQLFA